MATGSARHRLLRALHRPPHPEHLAGSTGGRGRGAGALEEFLGLSSWPVPVWSVGGEVLPARTRSEENQRALTPSLDHLIRPLREGRRVHTSHRLRAES